MEMVNINLVILMIRDMLFNVGCRVGEIQLTYYNSMVTHQVTHTNILKKGSHKVRSIYPQLQPSCNTE